MKFDEAKDYIFNRLGTELPQDLTYHDLDHTQAILKYTERLAALENVTGDALIILKTAACYHDSGFLDGYAQHEEKGCELVRKELPRFGYSQKQIEVVCNLILATKIPQAPTCHLCEIICDADLYYLGTNHYPRISHKLYLEFLAYGILKGKQDWFEIQVKFLSQHSYFTKSAKSTLDAKKQVFLDEVLEEVKVSKS